jgi:hypothetical protein
MEIIQGAENGLHITINVQFLQASVYILQHLKGSKHCKLFLELT